MIDWIFDGVNKTIKEPQGLGDTTFDITRDIYSAWKRWVLVEGAKFEQALSVEGGTPIGSTGLFTGTTFILINGWKLQAADHDGQVIVIGNIYSDDGIVSVNNPLSNRTLFASGTIGAQGIATSGGGSVSNVWTTEEKNKVISDTEDSKRQATIAAMNSQRVKTV